MKLFIMISITVIALLIMFGKFHKAAMSYGKDVDELKKLFEDKLQKMCNDAKTEEECNAAWKVLIEVCCDDDQNFVLPSEFKLPFYQMRAFLAGKMNILRDLKQK